MATVDNYQGAMIPSIAVSFVAIESNVDPYQSPLFFLPQGLGRSSLKNNHS
jgi:hypothetical protein